METWMQQFEVILRDTEDPDLLVNTGDRALSIGWFDLADRCYVKAMRRDAGDIGCLLRRVAARLCKGDPASQLDALDDAEFATYIEPSFSLCHLARSACFGAMNRLEDAAVAFTRARSAVSEATPMANAGVMPLVRAARKRLRSLGAPFAALHPLAITALEVWFLATRRPTNPLQLPPMPPSFLVASLLQAGYRVTDRGVETEEPGVEAGREARAGKDASERLPAGGDHASNSDHGGKHDGSQRGADKRSKEAEEAATAGAGAAIVVAAARGALSPGAARKVPLSPGRASPNQVAQAKAKAVSGSSQHLASPTAQQAAAAQEECAEEDGAGSGEEDDVFDDLERWLVSGGNERFGPSRSRFPRIHMRKYAAGYRGVHASEDIPPESEIMAVDGRYLITVEMGKNTWVGRRMMMARPHLELSAAKHCYTAVFILLDRRDPDSFYSPYYRVLPKEFPTLPIFWTEAQLQWLRGSHLIQQVKDRRTNIRTDYAEICRAVPEFGSIFSIEDFFWARMVVASRNFGVTIRGQKTDAMVPYADMLNHYRPRETRWTFNNQRQCFTIHSITKLVKGEQVFDSYGKKCNSRFLLNYGFAVDHNRDDEAGQNHNEVRVVMNLLPPSADHWRANKLSLLDGIAPQRPVRLAMYQTHPGTKEALSYARFVVAEGREVNSLPYVGDMDLSRSPIQPISCRNEAAALRYLSQVCEQALRGYPTTLEEDLRVLISGEISRGDNRRNCLVLVKGEKEILTHFSRLADVAVPLLLSKGAAEMAELLETCFQDENDIDRYVRSIVGPLVQRERGYDPHDRLHHHHHGRGGEYADPAWAGMLAAAGHGRATWE